MGVDDAEIGFKCRGPPPPTIRNGVDDDLLVDADNSIAKTDCSAIFTDDGVNVVVVEESVIDDVVVALLPLLKSNDKSPEDGVSAGFLNRSGRGLGRGGADWMMTTGGLWRTLGGAGSTNE